MSLKMATRTVHEYLLKLFMKFLQYRYKKCFIPDYNRF